MKRTFTILAFNALIVAILFTPLVQSDVTPKPLADALFFVITVYAATIVVISSYRVGRVIFNRENNKILSVGFFYALIGFMFLSLATLGYLDYVKGFKPVSVVISLLVLVISFVILPMLVARKNTSVLKIISRVTREF